MKKWIFVAGCLFSLATHAQTNLVISATDEEAIKKLALEKDFSGTVLVLKGDSLVLSINQGKASETNGVAFSPDVRMNACSNGKSMTAVMIQQLIAKGILRPDQTVIEMLPDETQLPNAGKITLQQLLTHTSGLGDFFEHPDYKTAKPVTTEDFMQLMRAMKPVNDTPGNAFAYSNGGYIVLGKILEKHYQKPYQQIVKEQLLLPLGIDTAQKHHTYATGYFKQDDKWTVGDGNDPDRWSAAGGLYLSVNEWHRFTKALATGQLLDTASLRQAWTRYSRPEGNPEFVGYGRGFMIESPAGLTFIGHNGGIKGFQSAYRYVPQADMYIYVFSNHDGSAEAVFMYVLRNFIKQYQQLSKS